MRRHDVRRPFKLAMPICIAVYSFVFTCLMEPSPSAAADDPVTEFIVRADSIAQTGDDSAFSDYVVEKSAVVGAAVGQLLDVAIEVGDSGDLLAEKENIEFAMRVSHVHFERTGSNTPHELAEIYANWTVDERAERKRAVELEAQALDARNEGDLEKAADLFERARTLFESIGDKRSVAVTWGSLGVVAWYAGDFDRVFDSYNHALEARRQIEDRILEGKTLNGLGSANLQTGNFEKAASFYLEAIRTRKATGDLGGLGTSFTYLGNAYAQLGRPVDARESFEKALPLVESAGNTTQQFQLLNSIANLNSGMGRLRLANDAYRRATRLAEAEGDVVGQMVTRNNLALNLTSEYKYGDALRELRIVQGLLAESPDPEQTIVFHRNSGVVYLNVGELDLARDHFLLFLRVSEEHEAPAYQVEALINLGYLLQEFGDYERALLYAKKAHALASETGQPQLVRESTVLSAQLNRLLGRHDDALMDWEFALAHDNETGIELNILVDRIGFANALVLAGRSDEALERFSALCADVEQSGQGDLELALYFGMGHVFESEQPDSSRHYYERALSIMDDTRSEIGGAEIRTGYLGGIRRHYYEEVARFYASQTGTGKDDDWSALAFRTIERAKARGLLELIEVSVAGDESPRESAVLDSLYRLDPAVSDYGTKKQDLTDQYLELRDSRVGATLGGLRSASRISTLKEVQEGLPKNTTMLIYALGDSASLLWVVDRKGHELHELPNRKILRPEVERLRDAMSRPGAADAALRVAARGLYRSIVEPAVPRISKNKNLIIVPDGFLFEMPFEVLLTDDFNEGDAWSDLPFLARSFSPVYAPSATVYLKLRNSKDRPEHDLELFALGDPEFSSLGSLDGSLDMVLDPLPASRTEVMEISGMLPNDKKIVVLGSDANEHVFKKELRGSSPRLVHLATHGLIDPLDPTASSVVLAADSSTGEDGYLHTLEILSLRVETGLVVLSACESARGRVSRGEGVVGLSRAFIASGARGTVASLWAVSDESTAILMKDFYSRMLGKKKPAGEALNEARLDLMKTEEFSHPFYWSPFVVIGSDRSPW